MLVSVRDRKRRYTKRRDKAAAASLCRLFSRSLELDARRNALGSSRNETKLEKLYNSSWISKPAFYSDTAAAAAFRARGEREVETFCDR